MSKGLLPSDANGRPIPVLAPRSSANYTLTDSFAEVLAADGDNTRTVAVFATDEGVYIRVGTDNTVGMRLPQRSSLAVKVDATLPLQAKGSGTFNVTVMG